MGGGSPVRSTTGVSRLFAGVCLSPPEPFGAARRTPWLICGNSKAWSLTAQISPADICTEFLRVFWSSSLHKVAKGIWYAACRCN